MATPYLDVDLDRVTQRLREFQASFADADICYAVKANPDPQVLATLARGGCGFDVASPAEVAAAFGAGGEDRPLVYSNPAKKRSDIVAGYRMGVDLFVADSPAEVDKIAEAAPGSSILARLTTSGAGSDWPLSRKFGCSADECARLLRRSRRLGLRPAGVTFHVGSQQRDPNAWREPVERASQVYGRLIRDGIEPWLIDLGGGFPADLDGSHPALSVYAEAIEDALRTSFGGSRPRVLVEPGRGLVADAGRLHTKVIGVADRDGRRWVYLDAGVFTGLAETLDEAIRYRITTSADGRSPIGPAVLAGPTCDTADILYERTPVQVPIDLTEGDVVTLHAAGAYTTSYSTRFNGFDPLPITVHGATGTPALAVVQGQR